MVEFSQILGIPILDQLPFTGLEEAPKLKIIAAALHLKRSDIVSNWETRSKVNGFLDKFLIEKAQLFWDDLDFQAFKEVLAHHIYGLVMFPNPDLLINVNDIKVFLSRNLVPTLLRDI